MTEETQGFYRRDDSGTTWIDYNGTRTRIVIRGEVVAELPGELPSELSAAVAELVARAEQAEKNALLAGSELDWLIGYLSETNKHAVEHARRARAALAGELGESGAA